MSGPGGVAGDQLRALVERIEHVEEEIKALTEDKKDIYAEAKGQGFDIKILREVVRIRKKDPKDNKKRDALAPQIDWTGMRHGVLWSVLYTVVLVGIAYRHFRRKDILS